MEFSIVFIILSAGLAMSMATPTVENSASAVMQGGKVIDHIEDSDVDSTLGGEEDDGEKEIAGLVIYKVEETTQIEDNAHIKDHKIKYLMVVPKIKDKKKKKEGNTAGEGKKGKGAAKEGKEKEEGKEKDGKGVEHGEVKEKKKKKKVKDPSPPKGKLNPRETFLEAALRETKEETGLTEDDFVVYSKIMKEMRLELKKSQKKSAKESVEAANHVKRYKTMQFFLTELNKNAYGKVLHEVHTNIGEEDEIEEYRWVDLNEAKELWKDPKFWEMMAEFEEIIKDFIKFGLGAAKRWNPVSGRLNKIKRNVWEADLKKAQEGETKNWMKGCCGEYNQDDALVETKSHKRLTLTCKRNSLVNVNSDQTIIQLNNAIQDYNKPNQNIESIDVFSRAQKDFKALMESINTSTPDWEDKKHYILKLCYDTYNNMVRVKAIMKASENAIKARGNISAAAKGNSGGTLVKPGPTPRRSASISAPNK